MNPALGCATAVTFVWLGMVLAISFIETPLKFQAPDVTVRIGVGIGRLVFQALNRVESLLAGVLIIAMILGQAHWQIATAAGCATGLLAAQVAVLRPQLSRRSDRIMEGGEAPRSRRHEAYVALEIAKVAALSVTGILLLAG